MMPFIEPSENTVYVEMNLKDLQGNYVNMVFGALDWWDGILIGYSRLQYFGAWLKDSMESAWGRGDSVFLPGGVVGVLVERVSWLRGVVEAIVYTAATFLATVLLAVETPATGGYFNLGEAAIYSVAFLASSPWVAGVAGGVGPALADLALGFSYFAPATLVIKFTEGYLVARLGRSLGRGPGKWARITGLLLALGLAAVVAWFLGRGGGGVEASVEWVNVSLAGIEFQLPSLYFSIPAYLWLLVAVLIAGLGVLVAFVPGKYYHVVAMSLGGLVMVTGYFLYEYFVSNPLILGRDPVGAVLEVPANIGQAVAGILLAYPVVRFVERAGGRAAGRMS